MWLRGRQIWRETRWILLGISWLAGLALGYAGFVRFAQDHSLDWSASDAFYRTLQLVILESGSVTGHVNWMLQIARFFLPFLTAFTVLQAVMHLFEEQTQWIRLWGLKDHVVVCGLGRKGSYLASALLSKGWSVVVIEKELRHDQVTSLRRRGVVVIEGDATDPAVLAGARLHRARYLVSVLGQDGQNLRVAIQAYGLAHSRTHGKLTCIIHVSSLELVNLIKNSELCADPAVPFHLEVFNAYSRMARLLLQRDPAWQATTPLEELPQRVLVVGMGRLGESLVRHMAYVWYLLKRPPELHITVVDRAATAKCNRLLSQYPQIRTTCRLIPVDMDLCEVELLSKRLSLVPGNPFFNQVFICLSDTVLGLQVCLHLVRTGGVMPSSVWVRLAGDSDLADLTRTPLPGQADARQIKTFDVCEQTCSADLLSSGSRELLARGLYETYLVGTKGRMALQDEHLQWERLSEEEKEANRQQADRIYRLLQTVGYTINPLQDWDASERVFSDADTLEMARLEHELWRRAKEASGWRYGARRDNQQRTHPDLVPWEMLEPAEKEKNLAFVRELPRLLAGIGFQIDRKP